jgi:hypothetical protein
MPKLLEDEEIKVAEVVNNNRISCVFCVYIKMVTESFVCLVI